MPLIFIMFKQNRIPFDKVQMCGTTILVNNLPEWLLFSLAAWSLQSHVDTILPSKLFQTDLTVCWMFVLVVCGLVGDWESGDLEWWWCTGQDNPLRSVGFDTVVTEDSLAVVCSGSHVSDEPTWSPDVLRVSSHDACDDVEDNDVPDDDDVGKLNSAFCRSVKFNVFSSIS